MASRKYPDLLTIDWRCWIDPRDRAPVCIVADDATTLVLFKGETIVQRVPVQLNAEGITDLDL